MNKSQNTTVETIFFWATETYPDHQVSTYVEHYGVGFINKVWIIRINTMHTYPINPTSTLMEIWICDTNQSTINVSNKKEIGISIPLADPKLFEKINQYWIDHCLPTPTETWL